MCRADSNVKIYNYEFTYGFKNDNWTDHYLKILVLILN